LADQGLADQGLATLRAYNNNPLRPYHPFSVRLFVELTFQPLPLLEKAPLARW
jgi:hypothetical protein